MKQACVGRREGLERGAQPFPWAPLPANAQTHPPEVWRGARPPASPEGGGGLLITFCFSLYFKIFSVLLKSRQIKELPVQISPNCKLVTYRQFTRHLGCLSTVLPHNWGSRRGPDGRIGHECRDCYCYSGSLAARGVGVLSTC